jgi:cell shape-determining protein MreD
VSRIATFLLFTIVVTAVSSALAVTVGSSGLPVTAGSIVVAYAALATPPIEAAFSAALVGLVVDALNGAALGTSSFTLLATLLASRLGIELVPTNRGWPAWTFVGVFAFAQTLLAMLLLALFGQRSAVDVGGAVAIGVVDGVVAMGLFPALHGVLVLLRVEERSATLGERLQAR